MEAGMFDEPWAILKAILIFGAMWAVIFKASDVIQNLRWLQRRRIQKAFDAANKWSPKQSPERTPASYRVLYRDGATAEITFIPAEIDEWVANYNGGLSDNSGPHIFRVLDTNGKIIWPAGG